LSKEVDDKIDIGRSSRDIAKSCQLVHQPKKQVVAKKSSKKPVKKK
jgi:hypothetical protein